MPTYEVDVGGKTYEVDAPDPNTAWQWANYTHSQAPKAVSAAPFSFKDTAISAAQGAVGATKSIAEAFGAGNAPAEYLEGVQKGLGSYLSPERQAEQQRRAQLEKEAARTGKPLEEISAGLGGIKEAPVQSIAQGVGSAAPTVALGVAAGALGATFGAPLAIAAGVGIGVKYLIGALQGAGEVKGSVYDAVREGLEAKGMRPEQAKEKAHEAQNYIGDNWGTIAAGAGLGAWAGGTGAEKELLDKFSKPVAARIAAQAGKKTETGIIGAGLKEALPEGAQGGQEQYAQNKALQRAGIATPTWSGVAGATARDAALGALTGSAIHPFTGAETKPTPPPAAPEAPAQEDLQPPVTVRPYGGLVQAMAKLKQGEQTPETQAEIAKIRDELKSRNVAEVEKIRGQKDQAAADEEKAKGSAFAAKEPQQMEMNFVGGENTGAPKDLQGNAIQPEPAPAAVAPAKPPEQMSLGLRRTPEGQPTTTGKPEPTISAEDVMLTAIPLPKPVQQWVEKNVTGRTPTQLRDMIKRDPTLVEGKDPRAQLLKTLLASEVPAFEEAPNVKTTEKPATQPNAQPGGSQPSVAVSGEPAGTRVVTPRPRASAPAAGAPAKPVGLGLVPSEQPVGKGNPAPVAQPGALTERQQRIEFGKSLGAAQPYPGMLRGRKNQAAQAAATRGDFAGVVSALENSKNATVAEVARRAKSLGTKIKIDDAAGETYEGRSQFQDQMSIDGAKMHLEALEKLRGMAPQVAALKPGAALPYSISGASIKAINNGEEMATSQPLRALVENNNSMFTTLGLPETRAFRTKEDFDALMDAFERTTQELGEDKLHLTSTASSMQHGVAGVYDADTDTIRIPEYFAKDEAVLAHEILHAQVLQAVANPTLAQRPVVQRLTKLYEHVKREMDARERADKNFRKPYGAASVQEFIAEGLSNPDFQYTLSRIEYENTTAWSKFVENIAKLLGLQNNTALTELLTVYDALTQPEATPKTAPVVAKATPPASPTVTTETSAEAAQRKANAEAMRKAMEAQDKIYAKGSATPAAATAPVTQVAIPKKTPAEQRAAQATQEDKDWQSVIDRTLARNNPFEVLDTYAKNKERKSVGTMAGQTLDQLQNELASNKTVLGKAMSRLLASGKVRLEANGPKGVGGLYDGQKVTLYASGIPSGHAMAVALHEVGAHLGLRKMIGDAAYQKIADRITELAKSKENSPARALAQRALNRITEEDVGRGKEVVDDEAVAYFVEELAKAEASGEIPKAGALRALWNQIRAIFTAAVNRTFGTTFGAGDLTPEQIGAMASAAMVRESKTGIDGAPTTKRNSVNPTAAAFKNWFGNSKVVDADGEPLVVYHGTMRDFDTFKVSPDGALGAGIYTTPSADFAGTYADTSNLNRADAAKDEANGQNVMPVYVSIQNPLVLDNERGDPMVAALVKLGVSKDKAESMVEKAYEEHGYIRKQVMTRAVAHGYDGIMQYRGGELREVVAFKPTQLKSATGNKGTYDATNPNIRFSVSPASEQIVSSMGPLSATDESMMVKGITGFRADAGIDYVTQLRTAQADSAAALESRFHKVFNGAVRDAMGKLNPMGLYRQAQDHAKLLLEFFQRGGLEKDATTGLWKVVDRAGKEPTKVYKLINAYAEKNGYSPERATQIASRVLEAYRLEGILQVNPDFPSHMTKAQMAPLLADYKADPAFAAMNAAMDAPRIALIDHMIAVGRLSKEKGAEWKAVAGYVPFDRENFGEVVSKFTSRKKLTGKSPLALSKDPQLVGSMSRPVGNVFDNYINTLGWMVKETMNNDARVTALNGLQDLGFANDQGHSAAGDNVVGAYVDGEMRYWKLPSKYDVMAFKDLNPPKWAIMRFLGQFSNILRTTITALPPFALKQVTDDIQRGIFTSGVKDPLALTAMSLSNFPKLALAELLGKQHPFVRQFGGLGLTGEFDFHNGRPADSLLADLGYKPRGAVKELLHRLNGITRASDLAVRKAIYDQTIKETGDALLAQTRAREFINFRRRGASEFASMMTTTIPFYNSYVQGMDVLYRAASGIDSSSSVGRAEARKLFWSRALVVSSLSALYALGKSDDDDYKDMDLRTRDSNWILGNGLKLSVPGELGAIFKVIPERVVEYYKRQGTPEEQEAFEAMRTTLSYMFEQYGGRVMPIPQAAKPLLEAFTNHSFLTGRELEGIHQKGMLASDRRASNTSELAVEIAKFVKANMKAEVSPILIDNAIRGYFGSTAAITTMVTDGLLNPTRMDRPLHKWALLSNYMYDPVGTRCTSEFYDTREQVFQASGSLKELARTDINAAEKFAEEHSQELALESSINSTLQQIEQTRAYRKYLDTKEAAAEMTQAERQSQLEEVRKYETEMVGWLREAKTELRKQYPQ